MERLHPDVPMGPGRVQGREFEYVRHGTLCLMANLEVWCGQILAPSIGPTRTEQDFQAHVEQTVNTDPLAGWVFLVDNLDTNQSESLVWYVAEACGMRQRRGMPARRPASMSVRRSPIRMLAERSSCNSSRARRSMPGLGLRSACSQR